MMVGILQTFHAPTFAVAHGEFGLPRVLLRNHRLCHLGTMQMDGLAGFLVGRC
jgi:hypothetical protein